MRILHLEDSPSDAYLVQRTLRRHGVDSEILCAKSADEFRDALTSGAFDVIVVDNGLPGFDGRAALEFAREVRPDLPLIFCSGAAREEDALAKLDLGATDYVLKEHLWQLVAALRRVASASSARTNAEQEFHDRAMLRLVQVVQDLSLARDMHDITEIVRHAARELTGADGATLVLRDQNHCYYVDEDAIEPLWKGQRFPLSQCISGWTMLNGQCAVIPDIYADARILQDAYRPTFVKSLAMVPIRTADPLGAIGNYWAHHHVPGEEELALLQTLANTTSVAIQNVQLYKGLERRVQERTAELKLANEELETFSFAVSHDLRAPLRAIGADLAELQEAAGALSPEARSYIGSAQRHSGRMSELIDDLMRLGRVSRAPLQVERLDLSALVAATLGWLQDRETRPVEQVIAPDVTVDADPVLLKVVVENLLSNALKYSSRRDQARIEFGVVATPNAPRAYYVRDNGAGFDMRHAQRLFHPFVRLHGETEFSGNGVGLATVRRVIERHGGRIWAESQPDRGATFYFTLAG